LEIGNVDAVLDGELDELVDAYLRWKASGGEGGGVERPQRPFGTGHPGKR
jgi:hypothetical protein